MKIWITADNHFGHANIVKYCNRPADHEERMWAGLSMVGPEDTLIHLGDVGFGTLRWLQPIVDRLPGKEKILVEGNHDKRGRIRRCAGWSQVIRLGQILRLKHGGLRFAMTHRPQDLAGVGSADIFVHGHIHDVGKPWRWENDILVVNICVEQWNYRPILINDLVEIHEKWHPGKDSNLQPAD